MKTNYGGKILFEISGKRLEKLINSCSIKPIVAIDYSIDYGIYVPTINSNNCDVIVYEFYNYKIYLERDSDTKKIYIVIKSIKLI